mmetsp:Transcript_27084/g.78054  ORF Transcript_27084/g.78054 Transcript_27084/m.78054 type:complete len:316 (+) Transcript_27084:492-1439(+)
MVRARHFHRRLRLGHGGAVLEQQHGLQQARPDRAHRPRREAAAPGSHAGDRGHDHGARAVGQALLLHQHPEARGLRAERLARAGVRLVGHRRPRGCWPLVGGRDAIRFLHHLHEVPGVPALVPLAVHGRDGRGCAGERDGALLRGRRLALRLHGGRHQRQRPDLEPDAAAHHRRHDLEADGHAEEVPEPEQRLQQPGPARAEERAARGLGRPHAGHGRAARRRVRAAQGGDALLHVRRRAAGPPLLRGLHLRGAPGHAPRLPLRDDDAAAGQRRRRLQQGRRAPGPQDLLQLEGRLRVRLRLRRGHDRHRQALGL